MESGRWKQDGETKGGGGEGGEMMRKLREGVMVVGKRGGPTTPPPTWRLELLPRGESHGLLLQPTPSSLSARKLCAGLWDFQPRMTGSFPIHQDHGHRHPTGMGPVPGEHPPARETLRLASNGDLGRHVVAAREQEYYPIRDDAVHQSFREEGCSSSVEEAHFRRSSVRPSSFDPKGVVARSSCSPRTSTELLKVLNRIWSLEERHTSNKSILKALRSELDQSQMRIKELMREKRNDKQLMEHLLKQVTGDKLVRNQKKQDKAEAETQLLNEELEEERSLRNQAESLHRKLAKEFDEIKSTYLGAQQELERERKARILLESLCDEFAKGIRDYEQVVRSLTNKPVKQNIGRECLDRLILHISEAWLDERLQMKLTEAKGDSSGKSSIVDKLNSDIETFLQAKQKDLGETSNISPSLMEERRLHRHSPESFALNEVASAPRVAVDEDQSPGNSLELSRQTHAMGGKMEGILNEPDNDHLPDAGSSTMQMLNRSRAVNLKDNKNVAALSCQGDICVLSMHPATGRSVKQRPAKVTWPPSRKSKGKSCSVVEIPGGIREGTLMAKLLEARMEGQHSSSKAPQGSE
ncbi:hypothetical protein MLD38_023448 [Melastoma candidum]|uniref:Uncharacterized protein n=1 Tax=Melastoma candidum TaxID=119954 RepID=A0ACB9NPI6_9MYRT|nr:hypothetical protein MLD38_023448 [Melastoma candidum]